jgi:hypothetical protein
MNKKHFPNIIFDRNFILRERKIILKYQKYMVWVFLVLGLIGCNLDFNKTEVRENETEVRENEAEAKENETEVREIYIDHYKSECFGFALSLCMRSKSNFDDDWELFYESIKGFEYEWGYTYKLKINVEKIENPLADASSLKYTLIEVVNKKQETSTTIFDIAVSRAPNLVINVTPEIYKVYGEKTFSCATEECQSIDSLVSQNMAILFEFTHSSTPSAPLLLTQIKCSSSKDSFRSSCL